MKKIYRKSMAWTLYFAGDLVSRWNDHDARFTDRGYRLYQWLMLKSDTIQGDGPGPWGNPNKEKKNDY